MALLYRFYAGRAALSAGVVAPEPSGRNRLVAGPDELANGRDRLSDGRDDLASGRTPPTIDGAARAGA